VDGDAHVEPQRHPTASKSLKTRHSVIDWITLLLSGNRCAVALELAKSPATWRS
jgi:hypothetical protein